MSKKELSLRIENVFLEKPEQLADRLPWKILVQMCQWKEIQEVLRGRLTCY